MALNTLNRDGTPATRGWVFHIQKFSLHDGPGIRDVVFLKGCPLRCKWCANPESWVPDPGIMVKPDRCIGMAPCGLCTPVCPENAIMADEKGRAAIHWDLCTHCGQCAAVCPAGALDQVSRLMTVDEVLKRVGQDYTFHSRSGGGVTLSGGEPLMQADFAAALLKACRSRLIHTALETSGCVSWEKLEQVARHADLIHYDIKSLDDEAHRRYTGVSNRLILKNLSRLVRCFPQLPVIVRTPVIPGVNDTPRAIREIRQYLDRLDRPVAFELMPFHKLGFSKYLCVGKTCPFEDATLLSDEQIEALRAEAGKGASAAAQ